jgi:hypothetical protein
MINKIHLNNNYFQFTENDLPCLIHYSEGTGSSHFSVTMVADLFLSGSKILFLTAYHMAKDNFIEQVKGRENDVLFVTSRDQLTTNKQAIIIESGNENLFLEALNSLDDINERIIFIKNFEGFNNNIILSISNKQKLIISGDLDSSPIKNELISKKFKTIIQFSKSSAPLTTDFPNLEKYVGYFWQDQKSGLIQITTS